MSVFIKFIILASISFRVNWSEIILQDLGGNWLVTGETETGTISENATVPGGIYSDLMNAGIIGDIFYGMGDQEYLWVSLTNWTYTTTFTVNESLLSDNYINLVFEGLDTFATILINDVEIGKSENMFVRYIFPVKNQIQLGDNTLEVRFSSAVTTAATLAEEQSQDYVVPPDCPAAASRGACHVNQIRKMQASFSWDWGPSFPSVGIWKDVYLEGFNDGVLRDIIAVTTEDASDEMWYLVSTMYLSVEGGNYLAGEIATTLYTVNEVVSSSATINETIDENGEIPCSLLMQVPMDDVKRWWPNGYGDPNMYKLVVEFTSTSAEKTSKEVNVGFRTVRIVQDQLDSGLTFYFLVNDVPVFAKGSNTIPLNILPERGQDPNTIRTLLESARDANMNMLRVWGGGVYESDLFYQTADELGIMIWQDFMFACALYPTKPEYLNNVIQEVRHQIKRLYSHPSIVLFAGNNENEMSLSYNIFGNNENFRRYKFDYITLYVDTIKSEVIRILQAANYVVSSPSNGRESEAEGYVAANPEDTFYGDVHYYNYLSDSFDVRNFPIPRFASEYGYQSMPDLTAWLTTTNNISDLQPSSAFIDHRQHHPSGTIENTLLISYQITLPNESNENYYKAFIFYSQVMQAMSIKIETEHYRSYTGRLDETGQGYTMGALFWQLNDVWVAPTWSGIDFTGKWKMLQYFAKDFFTPTIVTCEPKHENIEIYVVSDVPTANGLPVHANVVVQVFDWQSFDSLTKNQFPITIQSGRAVQVIVLNVGDYLNYSGCGDSEVATTRCFFYFQVMDENQNLITPDNFYFPGKLKDSNIQSGNIKITSVRQLSPNEFEIVMSTDAIAAFVWLDSQEIPGKFSENGFLLVTSGKTVFFSALSTTTVEELENVLTVTHLRDPIYEK